MTKKKVIEESVPSEEDEPDEAPAVYDGAPRPHDE